METAPETHSAVTFDELEQQAPRLAQATRERMEATGLCLVGTLRSDGWPRISPVEPLIFEGQLYLGMMPASMKSQDLARDPRCLVHSVVTDKDGSEGEAKLYGVARRVDNHDEIERYCVALEETIGWRPHGPDDFDLWTLGITSGAFQEFSETEGSQTTHVWNPGQGLRSSTKTAPVG